MVGSVTFKKKEAPRWLPSTEILPTSWWLLVCNFMGFQRIKHLLLCLATNLGQQFKRRKKGRGEGRREKRERGEAGVFKTIIEFTECEAAFAESSLISFSTEDN